MATLGGMIANLIFNLILIVSTVIFNSIKVNINVDILYISNIGSYSDQDSSSFNRPLDFNSSLIFSSFTVVPLISSFMLKLTDTNSIFFGFGDVVSIVFTNDLRENS